ncbi:hypothetical protein BDV96DRAFT_644820 [Lophiotrema nucula]|uniref:Uncharacterized protein n=1 Tax=Lophiotrema nucula TaxID=690887 RepID=A0A6A5ZF95_9PLEO|nr:hypothetical protein BDV96DRAFT_644820 [Lophiotrema nucula]
MTRNFAALKTAATAFVSKPANPVRARLPKLARAPNKSAPDSTKRQPTRTTERKVSRENRRCPWKEPAAPRVTGPVKKTMVAKVKPAVATIKQLGVRIVRRLNFKKGYVVPTVIKKHVCFIPTPPGVDAKSTRKYSQASYAHRVFDPPSPKSTAQSVTQPVDAELQPPTTPAHAQLDTPCEPPAAQKEGQPLMKHAAVLQPPPTPTMNGSFFQNFVDLNRNFAAFKAHMMHEQEELSPRQSSASSTLSFDPEFMACIGPYFHLRRAPVNPPLPAFDGEEFEIPLPIKRGQRQRRRFFASDDLSTLWIPPEPTQSISSKTFCPPAVKGWYRTMPGIPRAPWIKKSTIPRPLRPKSVRSSTSVGILIEETKWRAYLRETFGL